MCSTRTSCTVKALGIWTDWMTFAVRRQRKARMTR